MEMILVKRENYDSAKKKFSLVKKIVSRAQLEELVLDNKPG